MGKFLQRLGSIGFHHPWRVIGGWVIVLIIVGTSASLNFKAPSNALSIPGTEGQKALDTLNKLFPDAGRGTARIVFAAPRGETLDTYKMQIIDASKDIAKVPGVTSATDPYTNSEAMSKDESIAYTQVQLDHPNGSVSKQTIDGVTKVVDKTRGNGLSVEMGGDIINKAPGEIVGIGEAGGVLLALVVLVITLGSLVAAGLPLVIALSTIAISMGGLFGLSQVVDINSTTPVLAIMLGLAVGIDYSLFIISKYRHYLLEGATYQSAVKRAIATAGNAVLFAAATVVIALSALTVANIPFMTTMGLAGAATIALAALIAVTMIPALLGIVKSRIFNKKTRTLIATAQKRGFKEVSKAKRTTVWYRWGQALTNHPVLFAGAGIIALIVVALPLHSLTLGLPTDQYSAADTTERKAYDLLAKGFGVGFNAPLAVVVEHVTPVTDQERDATYDKLMAQFTQKIAEAQAAQKAQFQQRAETVTTPEEYAQLQQDITTAEQQGRVQIQAGLVQVNNGATELAKRSHLQKIADAIAKRSDVDSVQVGLASADGTNGLIQVIPKSAPSDTATENLISALRNPQQQKSWSDTAGISYAVTGSTALQSDINDKLAAALPVYLAVVVGLSLLLLIIAFRSILIPLKATLGFLLSVGAMFGALVAVFQWGWLGIAAAPGPIISFIPIIAIGILFGLAMDYEFFLVSSMHEAHKKGDTPKAAVIDGFGLGSKVVTAAGIIMVAVFAGFISNHDATVQAIGFALSIGVLVDAFIVRMTIVPAVMTLLGKSAWWLPSWLDKILPHVSIEGEEKVDA